MRVLDRKINEFKEVTSPFHLERFEIKKGLALALRNFLNFLEDREIDEINGYNLDKWRKKINIPTAKVQEIYITDQELIEAYNRVKERYPEFVPNF